MSGLRPPQVGLREPHGAWLLAPAGAILVAAVIGALVQVDKFPYFASLVATGIGVFAGGFLALWSDRSLEATRQQHEADRETMTQRAARVAELEQQWKVVGLLHDELVVSRDGLRPPAPRAQRPRPDLVYTPLPVETWAALSASEELRNIPHPELVGYFAEAYHWVALVNRYEAMALKLQYDPAGVLTSVTSAIARDALQRALQSIKDHLESVYDPTALQEVTEAVEVANRTFAEIEEAIRAEGGTVPTRS